jgi:hypothetical protein
MRRAFNPPEQSAASLKRSASPRTTAFVDVELLSIGRDALNAQTKRRMAVLQAAQGHPGNYPKEKRVFHGSDIPQDPECKTTGRCHFSAASCTSTRRH